MSKKRKLQKAHEIDIAESWLVAIDSSTCPGIVIHHRACNSYKCFGWAQNPSQMKQHHNIIHAIDSVNVTALASSKTVASASASLKTIASPFSETTTLASSKIVSIESAKTVALASSKTVPLGTTDSAKTVPLGTKTVALASSETVGSKTASSGTVPLGTIVGSKNTKRSQIDICIAHPMEFPDYADNSVAKIEIVSKNILNSIDCTMLKHKCTSKELDTKSVHVCVEAAPFHMDNSSSRSIMTDLLAVIRNKCFIRGWTLSSLMPPTIKKLWTGDGRAKKPDMLKSMQLQIADWNLDAPVRKFFFETRICQHPREDIVDAFALAHILVNKTKLKSKYKKRKTSEKKVV